MEDSTKSARELFAEALRMAYEKGWEVKSTLENKGNNIMTISGTVAALLFGFGALFLKNLHPDYQFLFVFIALLIGGIIICVVAILLCGLSFRLQKYNVAIGLDFFAKNKDLIAVYKKAPADTFNNTMIQAYIDAMEQNNILNNNKTTLITLAQWMFFASMVIVPILLGIVVHAVEVKAVTFPIST